MDKFVDTVLAKERFVAEFVGTGQISEELALKEYEQLKGGFSSAFVIIAGERIGEDKLKQLLGVSDFKESIDLKLMTEKIRELVVSEEFVKPADRNGFLADVVKKTYQLYGQKKEGGQNA